MPAEPFKRSDRPNEHTPSKGPKIPLPDENIDRPVLEPEDIVLLKPADIDVIQPSLIKAVRRVAMTLVCAMVAIMCAMVLPSMLVAGGSPGAYVIGVLLAVSIGLAAVGPAMFLVGLGRLPKNEQVDLKELSERSDLSSVAREDWPDAMDKLRQYLEEYPVPVDLMTDDDQRRLEEAKRRLLGKDAPVYDPEKWMMRFHDEFQSVLDEVAQTRLRLAANWVAVKTAISPNSAVDMCIVLYWAFNMLSELGRVYNSRAKGYGTAQLMGIVFIEAYLARKLQDLEDDWAEHIQQVAQQVLPQTACSLFSRIAAKTADGLANRFLIMRLGRIAKAKLQPVKA